MTWTRSPRPERALASMALGVAIVGVLTPAVARRALPAYRVWDLLPLAEASGQPPVVVIPFESGGRDPWGRRWSMGRSDARTWGEALTVWSVGPDGVDDGGTHDDVLLDPDMAQVDAAAWVGVWAALGLLWVAVTLRAIRAPRGPRVGVELGLGALGALAPAALLALVIRSRSLPRLLVEASPAATPPHVGLVGAAWLVLTLAVLAWRARRAAPRSDRPAAIGRLLVGLIVAVIALVAAASGREGQLHARRMQRTLAEARVGDLLAFERLAWDEPEPLAELLADPPRGLAWVELRPKVLQGLGRGGASANRAMAWALAEGNPAPEPLGHLVRHDPGLTTLAAELRADLRRGRHLLRARPSLVAALVGPAPCVELLLSERDPRPHALARVTELLGGLEPDADLDRRRAWWDHGPALVDGWVVVTFARAQVERPWTVRLHDASEVERVVSGEPDVVVLGPVPPTPAGRWLVAEGQLEVELPEIRPGGWVWVAVDPDRRRATARWIARPE